MKMGTAWRFVLGVLLVVLSVSAPAAQDGVRAIYVTGEDFDTVKTFLGEALTARGLVVNNVSHIGDMLERTGKDLGATRRIYLKAEALEFCSAVVSRRMMEADPHNIVFCPYVISIYVLPSEPNRTYVAYRRPPTKGSPASRKALAEVERLLDGIIREALR
jgi:uncharacterized protein (DUF302 family)